MDKLFKALNDPIRRQILERLRERDMNAGEIADCFHVTKPTISHHLDLLKQADLILSAKEGQFIVYSLNTSVLDECMAWLMSLSKKNNKGKKNENVPEEGVAATSDLGRAVLRRRPAVG